MSFSPTDEQLEILRVAEETDDNILVQALAGAAKTSSLVLLAEALSSTSTLALAFNKKIQLEMDARFPPNVKSMTLNGLGHRTWMEASGRRLRVDSDKIYSLLSEEIKTLSSSDQRDAYENFAEIKRLIAFGKQCGYVPTDHFDRAKRLMDCEEFFNHIERKLTDIEVRLIQDVTVKSISLAMKGHIDFDDQVFMPTIFHGAFPRYPLVLVDEAQDLSALNHATLRKLAKKRLIAVGDSRQAIYGFRGAHEDSMSLLAETFSMTELTLSTSFRCPSAIVEHARWRAPHMKAFRSGGEVTYLDRWSAKDLPSHAAILCRNNAPLFSSAIRLLKAGRNVELSNGDIAKGLIKIMTKFGDKRLPREAVLDAIAMWEEKEKAKTKERAWGPIIDRASCMEVFAMQGNTLGEALSYIQHLLHSTGSLKLLTGHKAKGLEFDHVFILDEGLIGKEGQDRNLRYVMQTRAKETLTYIESKGYLE